MTQINTTDVATPTVAKAAAWGAAFTVFAFGITMASESEKYGDIAVTLTWVAAISMTAFFYEPFLASIAELTGTAPPMQNKMAVPFVEKK